MSVFSCKAYDDHEQVVYFNDTESGLKSIIAVHSTALGAAVGGCRMWDYVSDEEALVDVLRLSRGMTYKNAMAGLAMGGGKSIIIGNAKTMKTDDLFLAFGRFLDSLSGRYITAEDVGINPDDMAIVNRETKHVVGLEGKSGDPSPVTAYGVYMGIKSAVKHKIQSSNLEGLTISVQGLGHVGYYLCEYLHKEGAKLIVTDINQNNLDRVVNDFDATPVAPDGIYQQAVDVYAPCALGAVINDTTLPLLNTKIVAGAANNQLAEDRHGIELLKKGILYAPDYVINAGGIINVSFENNYNREVAYDKVSCIYQTLEDIFSQADKEDKATNIVADEMARAKVAAAKSSS